MHTITILGVRLGAGRSVLGAMGRFLAWLAHGAAMAQQRRALRELDDRLLRDIGLTRAQAEAEARTPIPWP